MTIRGLKYVNPKIPTNLLNINMDKMIRLFQVDSKLGNPAINDSFPLKNLFAPQDRVIELCKYLVGQGKLQTKLDLQLKHPYEKRPVKGTLHHDITKQFLRDIHLIIQSRLYRGIHME